MKKLALVFVTTVDRINRFVGDYVGYLILPMIFVICWELISRKFFNKPTIWAMEVTWMLFAVYIIWSGAPSLLAKAQVRMDAIYNRWKPRTQAIMDSLTFVCGFVFCAVLLPLHQSYFRYEAGGRRARLPPDAPPGGGCHSGGRGTS